MPFDQAPLKSYLKARDALKDGNRSEAERLIKEALGVASGGQPLLDNLDQFLDPDTIAGEGMLQLITTEATRRKQ